MLGGRQVWSSDICLHLDKLKTQKVALEVGHAIPTIEEEDEEFEKLEKKMKILESKLEKRKEIKRMWYELKRSSMSQHILEYQTQHGEST